MTQLPKSLYTILLLLVVGMQSIFAQNILINGDFESGGAGVGFQTNYFLPFTPGVSNPRNYLLTTDSFTMNNATFCNSNDHTTGTGKMMVVDGSGNAGDKFWELVNGGSIGVISGRTYQFSYWIRSISATNTAANSAIIAVNTNGTTGPLTLLSGPTQCPLGNPSAWTKVTYQWVATTNNAQIWLTDTQTAGGGVGNDFAIDDISLVAILPPLSITSSSVNPSCPNANNGTIIVSGVNGVPPYVTYTLSGTSSATNSTGVFNNLAPGTYSVSVLDSGGTQVSQNGIQIVDPANISITASSTSICVGETVTLTANGASAYTWSSTPNDTGITNVNAISQTVQPSVPTTYSISASTSSTTNLITNGDFSSGNTGFTTTYQFLAAAPTGGAQNAYGVVTNPQAWFNAFSNCGDHTTGTGRMLVADGATTPNSIVWRQIVPVVNNRVYNFGFWIQSVVTNNPANIEVFINGVSVGFRLAPTDVNCASPNRWVQFTHTWNSLSSNSADIVLYNRNINSGGNDFAIDDITFTTTTTCTLTASKAITVNPIPVVTAAVTSQPTCTSPLGSITVSSPIGATYEYSLDGTTYQTNPSFLNLAANTYPVRVRIVGTNCSSLPVSLTISSVAALPNVSASTGVAPNCGVKLIGNSTTLGVQLTWNGPGLAVNSPNPATATQNGTFTLTAFDPVSGCSNATSVIATLPTLPSTPLINTTQPSCVTATGSITVTAPLGANFEYSINGTTFQSGTLFSNVGPNTYNVVVRNTTTGCVSLPNTIQINNTIATPPPTVTSPIYYCQNSIATALSATQATGTTLKWYTVATGGTASTTAPTPLTTTVGSTTYYVSQTNGLCESTRVPLVVTVTQNFNESLNLFCDATRSTPTSVFFDWSNVTGWVGYNYTYSIAGGPLVTGYTSAASSISIPVPAPGTYVTFTITSVVGAPCVVSDTDTCHSPCTTFTNPDFATIPAFCSGSTAPILSTTSPNGITGSWNPSIISNTAGGNYIFTPDTLLFPCANTQTLSVAVTTAVTPTFASIPTTYCQSTTAPIIVLPTSSTNTPAITGTWNPGGINQFLVGTTTHTFTPDIGQCVSSTPVTLSVTVNPIVSPNFPAIGSLCSGSTAPALATTSPNGITGTWLPTTISNTIPGNYVFTPNANQCSDIQTLSVSIVNSTTADFAAIPSICSGSTAPTLVNTAPNGVSGTWSPAVIDNLVGGIYTFTPDPTLYSCAQAQVINIAVTAAVTPLFTAIPTLCENASAPLLPTSSINTPPITGTWNGPIDTTILGNTLYTFTPAANQCVTSVNTTMLVQVIPNVIPDFAAIPSFCENTPSPVLLTTSPNGISGNWNPATISNTNDASYLFTPNPGQCSSTQTLAISLIRRINPDFSAIAPFCVGDTAPVLALASPNGINGTWTPTTIDNLLSGTYLFTPDPTVCANPQTLSVTVNQPTVPDFVDLTLCVNSTAPVLGSISPNGVTGTWNPAVVDVTASAPYVFTPVANSCAVTQTIQVVINQPQFNSSVITYNVSDAFAANPSIEVIVTPAGNFLYQLDFGPIQSVPVFNQVAHGIHTVTVYDATGCSVPDSQSFEVMVIDYPRFFTPNGDGFNDSWNVVELGNLPATIYIFDRMGKLLKQITPDGDGWDGNYHGAPMPATDYWFLIEYEEKGMMKKFKSHFALKR